ncbi:MAG: hypothetical protein KAQ65_08080 [Candidatus Thorarchaeota archaeon]|nr:hypothetical protein [Candidatus Thorarchaeota archaeon]
MGFWFTEKVAYLLLVLSLILPFTIMYQYISADTYTIVSNAALWQFIFSTPDHLSFAVNPFGLIYFMYYGPSVYIAKVAYDAAKKGNWTRYDYAIRLVIVLVIQVAIMVIIPPFSGYPPPINIPLPIPGIIALLLTRLTVREITEVWEKEGEEEPAKDDVFNN